MHTIRTQSPDDLTFGRRTIGERDEVLNLQRIFSNDDALDEQVQQICFSPIVT